MFDYETILNLDFRDFSFWLNEAEKRAISERIKLYEASRVAWIDSADYRNIINRLETRLEILERGEAEVYQDNWKDLVMKGKG